MRIYIVLVREEDGRYTQLGETAAANPRKAVEALAKEKDVQKGDFVAVTKRSWAEVPGSFEPRFVPAGS